VRSRDTESLGEAGNLIGVLRQELHALVGDKDAFGREARVQGITLGESRRTFRCKTAVCDTADSGLIGCHRTLLLWLLAVSTRYNCINTKYHYSESSGRLQGQRPRSLSLRFFWPDVAATSTTKARNRIIETTSWPARVATVVGLATFRHRRLAERILFSNPLVVLVMAYALLDACSAELLCNRSRLGFEDIIPTAMHAMGHQARPVMVALPQ
jgi:hypothetical protein